MQKKLFLRVVTIALLIVLLLIPLSLIRGVVAERQGLQAQVENTIAMSLAGPQRLAGPLLVVPYIARETTVSTDDRGRESKKIVENHRQTVFMPENLTIDIAIDVESRYKGLYKALVYNSHARLDATFDVPANLGLGADVALAVVGKPWLAIALSDMRGLRATPAITWDSQARQIAAGTRLDALGDGLNAELPSFDPRVAGSHAVAVALDFAGTGAVSLAPLAKSTAVQMKASWPHPNFGGRFLPKSKQVDADGFTARWEVSHLASKNGAMIGRGIATNERQPLETFDVGFVEPVNIYLQAERAVKYGILFVALTFAAFFLFEVLKDLRIHPLQYGLVGLALALFFLLLVSLSEHIRFAYAYAIASAACVALIGYYLSHVLGCWHRGLAFAAKLALLYGVLYGLLLSEDNALMLGSLLLFTALAAIMVLTRRVDWYRLGTEGDAPASKA